MGKMFDAPRAVFGEEILRPETQGLEDYADGIENIVEAQQSVAATYLADGSVEDACPPLKALLHIADICAMFSREALLASDWYRERLETKQNRDIGLWKRHIAYLDAFASRTSHRDIVEKLDIRNRLTVAKSRLEWVSGKTYLDSLLGTIGADPLNIVRSKI